MKLNTMTLLFFSLYVNITNLYVEKYDVNTKFREEKYRQDRYNEVCNFLVISRLQIAISYLFQIF